MVQAFIGNDLVNKRLKPGSKPFEVRDSRLTGFLLRVQPTGAMTFYVEYARGKRVKLGASKAISAEQARQRAKEILGKAYQGADPMEAIRLAKAQTFGEFVDQVYAPWAAANIRTAHSTVARLKVNFADFRGKKLHDITPWIVEKWRAARLKTVRPATANRDLDDLKSAIAKAVAWGHLKHHPITTVKRSRIDTARSPRFLSEDEERRLRLALDAREERIRAERDSANGWRKARGYDLLPDLRATAFADHLKPMVILSLKTGARQGEVFSLTWADVDLAAGRVTIQGARAKSGTTRHIPLNTDAITALRGWRESQGAEQLVFPGKDGARLNNVRKSWEAVLAAAGITQFRWHDMRHDFASKLVMAAVDLNTVRELLGHSDYSMVLRYAHLSPEHKAAAVEKLVASGAST
jgi:integrase